MKLIDLIAPHEIRVGDTFADAEGFPIGEKISEIKTTVINGQKMFHYTVIVELREDEFASILRNDE